MLAPRFTLMILASLLFATAASANIRFLVTVGATKGFVNESPLKWAEQDAKRVEEVFSEIGGVSKKRSMLLLSPSAIELERALARLDGMATEARNTGEKVEVVFHYSGHGDKDALHLGTETYSIERLKQGLSKVNAEVTLAFIDACRTSSRAKGATLGPPFTGALIREPSPEGTGYFFSTQMGASAQESDSDEGGVFTQALIAALRGEADKDSDGRITLSEMWQSVYSNTLTKSYQTSASQRPEMNVAFAGEGALVLTYLNRSEGLLTIDESFVGSVLLLDARNGRVISEITKSDPSPVVIALPKRRIGVQYRAADSGKLYRGEFTMNWQGQKLLALNELSETKALASLERGAGDIDASPYFLRLSGGPIYSAFTPLGVSANVELERRLLGTPLFFGGAIEVARGDRVNDNLRLLHHLYSASFLSAYEYYWGPIRLSAGANLGLTWINQSVTPADKARRERIGVTSESLNNNALAPHFLARTNASWGLTTNLRLAASFQGGLFILKSKPSYFEERALTLEPQLSFRLGVEYEF